MACEMPCMSYMALYVISMHIVNSSSRHSNHWKLNLAAGKVQQAEGDNKLNNDHMKTNTTTHISSLDSSTENGDLPVKTNTLDEEKLMDILTNKILVNGEWLVLGPSETLSFEHCSTDSSQNIEECSHRNSYKDTDRSKDSQHSGSSVKHKSKLLTCGKSVNSTQYDHLRGIAERHSHPHVPEPDVAMVFMKKNGKSSEVDINELEEKLHKAKKEKPRSVQLYNQIGNFWRIKGNTQLSIECFRKALSLSPDNADVLLNLARVLFNLQYLDDAIVLTRRSLQLSPSGQNAWLQHFTLGEILKAYGHYQEARLHFDHALQLKPGFQPAQSHLRDLGVEPGPSVTQYTLFIVLFLVLGVLFGLVTSMEAGLDGEGSGPEPVKTQRHFNRAMAMRSIKMGINPRLIRLRKAEG